MDRFSDKVFGLLVWRAFLTTLIAILLTIARDLPLRVAFLAGANVALLFSLGLIAWSQSLTDDRVVIGRHPPDAATIKDALVVVARPGHAVG